RTNCSTSSRARGPEALPSSPRTGSAGIRHTHRKAGRRYGTNVVGRSSRDNGPGESGSRCTRRAAASCGDPTASSGHDVLARCSAKRAAGLDYDQVTDGARHRAAAGSHTAVADLVVAACSDPVYSAAVEPAFAACPGSAFAECVVPVGDPDPTSAAASPDVAVGPDPGYPDERGPGSAAADPACLASCFLAAACADPASRSSRPVEHWPEGQFRESKRVQPN